MPNLVAKHLERLKKNATNMPQKFWIPDDKLEDHGAVYLLSTKEVKTLINQRHKIMWGQLSCIDEQLNVQSAKLLIAYVNKVLSKLQEETTHDHLY